MEFQGKGVGGIRSSRAVVVVVVDETTDVSLTGRGGGL
jgi:hypothetical protein